MHQMVFNRDNYKYTDGKNEEEEVVVKWGRAGMILSYNPLQPLLPPFYFALTGCTWPFPCQPAAVHFNLELLSAQW